MHIWSARKIIHIQTYPLKALNIGVMITFIDSQGKKNAMFFFVSRGKMCIWKVVDKWCNQIMTSFWDIDICETLCSYNDIALLKQ